MNSVEKVPPTCWLGDSGVTSPGWASSMASSSCHSTSNSPSEIVGESST